MKLGFQYDIQAYQLAGRYSDLLWLGRSGDRIPVRERFSLPIQKDLGAYPAPCKWLRGLLPGLRQPGLGVEHPHSSKVEVKERVEIYLYCSVGLHGLFWVELNLPIILKYKLA